MLNILFNNPTTSIVLIVVWSVIIIASLIVEAETSELVAIWFGVGAIPALVCAVFETKAYIQLIVFAAVTIILIMATRPLVKKFNQKNTIPTNVDKLIGMIGKVTQDIVPNSRGEVVVNYQTWTAITNQNETITTNEEVTIKEIVGNKLVVEKIKEVEIK